MLRINKQLSVGLGQDQHLSISDFAIFLVIPIDWWVLVPKEGNMGQW
jgi:hypothetical protein